MRHVVFAIVIVGLFSAASCGGDSPPNVGGACTASGGCDEGLTCDPGVAGGYCTKACSTAGSTTECPSGSICTGIAGADLTCARICTLQTDCRDDLECNGVEGSDVKACKVKGAKK